MVIEMRRWAWIALTLTALQFAQADEPLRSGGDADFPPYEFLDSQGRAIGFNVDLLRAIAQHQGRDFEPRLSRWADARAGLASGQLDTVAMYVADFRADEFLFSAPFLIIYHEIFVRQPPTDSYTLNDLRGRTVLVQQDSWLHEQIIDLGLDAEMVLVDSEREALLRLARGDADAALVSTQVGRRILQQEQLAQLVTASSPLLPAPYAFAVRVDEPELLNAINNSLLALRASGEYNRIYEHWFGEQPPPLPDESRSLVWLVATLGSLALLILLAWAIERQRRPKPTEASRSDTAPADRAALLTTLADTLRQGDTRPALLLIDLDQFRLVNEQSDPIEGDAILQELQQRLDQACKPGEQLFRVGGDKFAVLIARADEDSAMARADALRLLIERSHFGPSSAAVHLTGSLGVSLKAEDSLTAGRLLKQAEAACFAAKERGRNRCCLFSRDDARLAEASDRMHWVREADTALRENRLLLHFQTIEPALASPDAPIRAEILLRLRQVDGQLVTAGLFMPACEHHHLAQRIDLHVIEGVLSWLWDQRDRLPEGMRLYINLSARSLDDDRFLPAVMRLFERYPVDSDWVGFEVTETAVMNHLKTGLKTIHALRDRGCVFALDDFGVGNSSMAYLKQLPVDEVKIDGAFIRAVRENPKERLVLREINTLIQTLGKASVVEQVETDDLRELVAELGIDYVQGWAISRPRPMNEFPLRPSRLA